MNTFPTIKEMAQAISLMDDIHDVTYNEKEHTFSGVEMYPYPCYDSGGGLDSVGWETNEVSYTFYQAYKVWEYWNELPTPNGIIPPPVAPVEDEDDELPF